MIPLRTDTPVRIKPRANHLLIALNIVVFLLTDVLLVDKIQPLKNNVLTLDSGLPHWWQLFTYQFLHGGWSHLLFNMLFLWVFGNAVNAKLGHLPYVLFYLSGGVFAGWGYALGHLNPLIGASGSIAAVTTAFMVLFPRSRIFFLFIFFIITTFELPSLWVILFKMILWDNILAPHLANSDFEGIATSAHLFGYVYGIVVILAMQLVGAISRDQFDLLAVIKRWNQRRVYASMMRDPEARAQSQYGTVARPISMSPQKRRELQAQMDRVAQLRGEIREALGDSMRAAEAADLYEQLVIVDPEQCLSRQQQLEMAKILYSRHKSPQAASALEKFIRFYPKADEIGEVRLLLGIIYVRDLHQPEAARQHLEAAVEQLADDKRREQAQGWLDKANAMGGGDADSAPAGPAK